MLKIDGRTFRVKRTKISSCEYCAFENCSHDCDTETPCGPFLIYRETFLSRFRAALRDEIESEDHSRIRYKDR
jgi:hypothetical protein